MTYTEVRLSPTLLFMKESRFLWYHNVLVCVYMYLVMTSELRIFHEIPCDHHVSTEI